MSAHRFNWSLWAGFALSPIAFLSYPFVFERWPATRDFPWVNLLLFALAGVLLFAGVRRAFAPGHLRAARIVASVIVTMLSVAIVVNFALTVFVHARHLPASANAPAVGQRAPDFTLPDENGTPVTLSELLSSAMPAGSALRTKNQELSTAPKAVLLIFSMYSGCRACNSEFHGIQQNLDALSAAGIRPVVISIEPPATSRALSNEAGYTFTFLSDPALDVITRYDVANGDIARPAEFLLDATGTVRWRNLTNNMFVRVRPEQILDAARLLP